MASKGGSSLKIVSIKQNTLLGSLFEFSLMCEIMSINKAEHMLKENFIKIYFLNTFDAKTALLFKLSLV